MHSKRRDSRQEYFTRTTEHEQAIWVERVDRNAHYAATICWSLCNRKKKHRKRPQVSEAPLLNLQRRAFRCALFLFVHFGWSFFDFFPSSSCGFSFSITRLAFCTGLPGDVPQKWWRGRLFSYSQCDQIQYIAQSVTHYHKLYFFSSFFLHNNSRCAWLCCRAVQIANGTVFFCRAIFVHTTSHYYVHLQQHTAREDKIWKKWPFSILFVGHIQMRCRGESRDLRQ